MANVRQRRQEAIRALVRNEQIRTQASFIELLGKLDFEVTQATISRDIAELGLEKDARGYYVLPEDHRLRIMALTVVHETRRAGNQVLVLSDPGTAPSIAAALDAAQLDGVLGCIAGDDTVLVICADERYGEAFQNSMNDLLKG